MSCVSGLRVVCLAAIMVAAFLKFSIAYGDFQDNGDADEEDAKQLLSILFKPRIPAALQKPSASYDDETLMTSFSWNDCGQSSDVAHLTSLSLSPDPIRLPGNITLGFKWQTTTDLTSPISMDLEVKKKIGFFWFSVPCNRIPGTCHHADVCADLSRETCPSEYQSCHCPVKKGTYTLPLTSFALKTGGIPSGDYRITARMRKANVEVGCIYMQLAVN